jgi:hypothetical protein
MNQDLKNALSEFNKQSMISFLKSTPDIFEEAIELSLADVYPYSWRAAWLLNHMIDENDKRFRPYIKRIIKILPDKADGHQRELLKILQKFEIEERYEGKLFDICFGIWEKIHKQPSIRITAFKTILKIADKHPELLNEISFIAQPHYLESLSPGIKNSVYRMIEEKKIHS